MAVSPNTPPSTDASADAAGVGALSTSYGQDRNNIRAQLDTFEGFVLVGKRRGEDRSVMSNLSAEEAKSLLSGISIDTNSPHAAVSDRDPARDPRLFNEPGFVSPAEHGAAKDAARDAAANMANPTDAAAKDAPERVAALNAGYKTDGARINNPTNERDANWSEAVRSGKITDEKSGEAALKEATNKARKTEAAVANKSGEGNNPKVKAAKPKK